MGLCESIQQRSGPSQAEGRCHAAAAILHRELRIRASGGGSYNAVAVQVVLGYGAR